MCGETFTCAVDNKLMLIISCLSFLLLQSRCASVIYDVLQNVMNSEKRAAPMTSRLRPSEAESLDSVSTAGVGADDFLPSFIWVVLTSNVPKLQSNCEYIQSYHNPTRMMSKAGYCFVSLRSALEFVLVADPSSLSVDPRDFYHQLHRAERELNGGV